MKRIEDQIEVECPVRAVYNQWTQFEEFPYFMSGVKEVKQRDDTHVYWRGELWGLETEWESEIKEQVPDERIAWESTSGPTSSGEVRFESLGPERTRVILHMSYEMEDAGELADMEEAARGHLHNTLEDFKHFIEQRGEETGAWRGEIHGGKPQGRGSSKGAR
jgi:uncharacterized membrane protein